MNRFSYRRAASAHRLPLRFEAMEDRLTLSANDPLTISPPVSHVASAATVEHDPSTGTLTITSLDGGADDVRIALDRASAADATGDLLVVTIVNLGDPLVHSFDVSTVTGIVFHGLGGNDRFDNRTAIASTALGGAGDDTLLGGGAIDLFYGGEGNDYLDGRAGDDTLQGEAGDDLLFGDAGDDTLYGDTGNDLLNGGAGDDILTAGTGDDLLDGSTGKNELYGEAGADSFFGFKLPKKHKPPKKGAPVSDFAADHFDSAQSGSLSGLGWFDANISDATLRSAARLHFRDAIFGREDLLDLFDTAAADGSIQSREYNDLKSLIGARSKLTIQEDVRVLAGKVIGVNKANARYQGELLGNLQSGDDGAKLRKLVDKWFFGGDLPVAAAGAEYVYVSGSLFQDGVAFTDIDQGSLGDCYFVGALAAVARQSPQVIYDLFTDNGDGTFSVRFFNRKSADFVTVNRFLPIHADASAWNYGRAYYAGFGGAFDSASNELWVALAEKAYVQMSEAGWTGQSANNSYAGIALGFANTVMSQLTGGKAAKLSLNGSDSAIVSQFLAGSAMTFASKTSGLAPGVVDNHIYVLVGYDAATETFRLYNPWGKDGGAVYPEFLTLTWKELTGNFTGAQSIHV